MEAVELRLVASVVIPLGNSEPFVERLCALLEAPHTAYTHRPTGQGMTDRGLPPPVARKSLNPLRRSGRVAGTTHRIDGRTDIYSWAWSSTRRARARWDRRAMQRAGILGLLRPPGYAQGGLKALWKPV